MSWSPPRCLLVLALGLLPLLAAAGKAHVHGQGRLEVGIEPRRITVVLVSPLDNLLGFERAPRTEAERRQADALLARLRAGDGLLRIDPAAGCRLGEVEVSAPALGPGAAPAADGHADLEASFRFDCADAMQAGHIEVGLFVFQRLKRLDAQVAGPRGQFKRSLTPQAARLALQR